MRDLSEALPLVEQAEAALDVLDKKARFGDGWALDGSLVVSKYLKAETLWAFCQHEPTCSGDMWGYNQQEWEYGWIR